MGRICAILLVALLGGGCGVPRATLLLSLPKHTWEEGEYLWYKLEIRNDGLKALQFYDSFWFDQQRLAVNMRSRANTYFIIRDARGNEVADLIAFRGMHGELVYWSNDCGAGVLCSKEEFHPFTVPARRSLTATPSIERPVQTSGVWSDARRCDRRLSAADCAATKRLADSLGKYGDSRRIADLKEGAGSVLPGHRILDSLTLPGPGKYTIQAVVDLRGPVPPASAEEDLARPEWCRASQAACALREAEIRREWAQKTSEALAEARSRRDSVIKDNASRLYIVSRVIEFEIVPAKRAGPSLGVETLEDYQKKFSSSPKLRTPPIPWEPVVGPR